MSSSPLVTYTKLSPNHSGKRTEKVCKITPHHMSGNLSVETCGNVFAPASRKASSNYGIGSDGRVAMYVPEDYRAWTSSSAWNDQRAVTIEVANSKCGGDWPISDKAWASLIELCVDICKRRGIDKLEYTGDKYGSLTTHRMFANTDCPGTWLDRHMGDLAAAVNARLAGKTPAAKPADKAPAKKPAATKKPTGKKADSWVRALQKECNKQGFSKQAVDGVAGKNTLAGCPTLRKGAKGGITKLMQKRLVALGYSCGKSGADGVFGNGTQAAVRAFQGAKGLAPDGVVGRNTWKKLLRL